MLEFGACPRCKLDISAERKKLRPLICEHCGYTESNLAHVRGEVEKKSIIIMAGIAVLAVVALAQLNAWDKYWLSSIPLSIKETIGMASAADHESRASMCFDLKKWDCTEAAYVKTAERDPKLFERAGAFQIKRGKFNEAAQSYYKFFQAGGQSLEASYNYAKSLAQLGKVDDAIKYFDQVLAARPETLQVTVVNNYVKLLVEHQRFVEAKRLIERVRKDGGSTAGSFMEAEFQKITAQMKTASR